MNENGDAGDVTRTLVDWIAGLVPKVPVAAVALDHDVPGADASGTGGTIFVRLLRAAPRFTPIELGRNVATLALDYLVSVRLPDPVAQYRALADIAFGALDLPHIELIADADAAETCRAFGLSAGSTLLLRTELRRVRTLKQAPLVREPAVLRLGPVAHFAGQVVGPGNQPIANATVTLQNGERSVTTGEDGRFTFALPAGTDGNVAVRARGRDITAQLSHTATTLIPMKMEA